MAIVDEENMGYSRRKQIDDKMDMIQREIERDAIKGHIIRVRVIEERVPFARPFIPEPPMHTR